MLKESYVKHTKTLATNQPYRAHSFVIVRICVSKMLDGHIVLVHYTVCPIHVRANTIYLRERPIKTETCWRNFSLENEIHTISKL